MKNTFSVFKFRNDSFLKSVTENKENIFYEYSFNNRLNELANDHGKIFDRNSVFCDREFTSSNKKLYALNYGCICISALVTVLGILLLLQSCSDKKYSDKKIYDYPQLSDFLQS